MTSTPKNSSLKAGLAALKQKDYARAIAHLEKVCESELDPTRVERAQMGLVVAYQHQGDLQKAIALCQSLSQSSNPQTQQWAVKTRAKLSPPTSTPSSVESPQKQFPELEDLNLSNIPKTWKQTGRAQRWGPLPKDVSLVPYLQLLWALQIATAIAFFWWMRLVFRVVGPQINQILSRLPVLRPITFFYNDPTRFFLIALTLLAIGLPWLMTGLLKLFYGLQPLTLDSLSTYSPDAAKVIGRFCRQRRLPIPQLSLLPTNAPVALTYGNLPRTARITVSQGLLEQLSDEEIATIYATQLAQIVHWDFAVMSWGVLVLQIPYLIYAQVAKWGEIAADRIERPFLAALLRGIAAVIANLSYGVYWILQLPLLWLSRWRLLYSDAEAVAITGNPNALIRALLKMAIATADNIEQTCSTSWLIESFNFLLPVGYRQSLLLGSDRTNQSFEAILAWDYTNPYRYWLSFGQGHPLIGDRLQRLVHYARYWRLDPELDLPSLKPTFRLNRSNLFQLAATFGSQFVRNSKALPLLPSAVLYGLLYGLVLRGFLWVIGIIGYSTYIWQLVWLSQNKYGYLMMACCLICFSVYLLFKTNAYFPDVRLTTAKTAQNLSNLQTNPAALPPDSTPIRLTGKLLGRRGINNGLAQDLILQTTAGLVKLHDYPLLGPLAYFGSSLTRPGDAIAQTVTVTGWLRRGATPWLDLETLVLKNNRIVRSYQPVWLILCAFAAVVWAAYLIWQAPST